MELYDHLQSRITNSITNCFTAPKVSDVTSFFADSTSRIASEFSHRNPGWQLAWNQYQRDGKPVAVNMRIALQQIIEADPWMLRPISDGNQMLSNADAAIGEDW